MSMLEKFCDAKNTLEGKALAVFMAVVLAFSMVSITAFADPIEGAGSSEATEGQADNASTDVAGTDANTVKSAPSSAPEASSPTGTPAAPGTPVQNETPSTEAPTTSNDMPTAEPGVAVIALDFAHAYVKYMDQTIALPTTSVSVPLNKDLAFSAHADEGYEIDKVQTAVNGAETELVLDEATGEYKVPADQVTSNLVLKVEAKAVEEFSATENPAADPITSDTKIDVEESHAPESEGPAPMTVRQLSARQDLGSYVATIAFLDRQGLPTDKTDERTISAGAFADGTVPAIDGYEFVGAYVGEGQIAFAGMLEGSVYYTAEGSLDSGVAMQLPEGARIELRYQTTEGRHRITYAFEGDESAETAFDGPEFVDNGSTLNFRLKVERGYTVSNVYANEKPLVAKDGLYAVEGVDVDLAVTAVIQKTRTITVSATTEGSPGNFHNASFSSSSPTAESVKEHRGFEDSSVEVGDDGASYEFQMKSGTSGMDKYSWQLDSLQINNTDLRIPLIYTKDAAGTSSARETTVLPEGAKVTVALVNVEKPNVVNQTNYTYQISVSEAKEDIKVTRGNFRASWHAEVMPTYGEGVHLQSKTLEMQDWGDTVSYKPVQTKVQAGKVEAAYFRVKLDDRYEGLRIVLNGAATALADMPGYRASDDGWAYFTLRDDNPSKLQTLELSASRVGYQVVYDASGGTGAPDDATRYDLVDNTRVLVSSVIPEKGTQIFLGWKIDGQGDTVYPGDVRAMDELVSNGAFGEARTMTLVAQWATKAEPSQAILVPVKNYYETAEGAYADGANGMQDEPYSTTSAKGFVGSSIVKFQPDDSALEGYVYDGDAGNVLSGTVADDGSLVLKQYYKRASYPVSYDGNGAGSGSVPAETAEYKFAAPVGVLGNTGDLAKLGHYFVGWNTASDGSGTAYEAGDTFDMPAAGVTLYAQWKLFRTIAYLPGAEGVTGMPEPATFKDVAAGTAWTVSDAMPERPGYTFNGWVTDDAVVSNGAFTMPDKDVTFTASWMPNEAKASVWFYLTSDTAPHIITTDGALATTGNNKYAKTITSEDMSGYAVDDLKRYAEEACGLTPEIDRYWYYDVQVQRGQGWVEFDGSYVVQPGDDIRYHVVLQAAHTVTYRAGDHGEGAPFTEGRQYYDADQVTVRTGLDGTNISAAEGYQFAGWATNDVKVAPEGTFTMPDKNVTFTAQWNKLHRVTYKWTGLPAGATLYDADGNEVTPKLPESITGLVKGEPYTIDGAMPGTVVYTHDAYGNQTAAYTLGEWSDPNAGVMGEADVIVSGVWDKTDIPVTAYPVSYEYTGNVPANAPAVPAEASYVFNQPVVVADAPTLAGYAFRGWDREETFKMPAEPVTIFGTWAADFSDLSAEGVDKTYNGAADRITVSGVVDGDEVRYYVDGVEVDNAFTNVGQSGTVVVKVTRGSETWTQEVPVAIAPALLTASTEGAEKTYDGKPLVASGYSIEGLVPGEKLVAHTTGSVTDVTDGEGVDNTYELDWADPGTTALEENYTVGPEHLGKLVVKKGAFEVTATGYAGVYDGQPHGITVRAPEDATVVFDTDNAYVDVTNGAVTVNYTVTRPNYGTVTGSQTVAITPAPVTIKVDDASKAFGAADPFFTGSVSGLVSEGDLGAVSYVRPGSGTDEDAAVYLGALTARYTENANYEVTLVDGTFTIAPLTISADAPSNVVYNGQEQRWKPVVTDEKGNVLVEGRDYTLSYSEDLTNAGTVAVTIEGMGNYVGTLDRTYDITPAEAVVRVNDSSKAFGTSDPAFSGMVENTFGQDKLGDIVYSRANADEAVGAYDGVLTATVNNPNPNYTYRVLSGDFTIAPADGNVVVANGVAKTYDGQPSAIAAEVGKAGSTLLYSTDRQSWSEQNPTFTDAGTYVVFVKATNPNYNETAIAQATVVIDPAILTVATPSTSKPYDGTALTAAGTMTGLVNNETATFATTGAQTEAASSDNTYAIDWNGTAKRGNYTVVEDIGTLTVVPAALTVSIVGNKLVEEYSATVHAVNGFTADHVDKATVTLKGGAAAHVEATDAGTYPMGLTAESFDVASANYDVKLNVIDGELRITPVELTIAADNSGKVYGQDDPALTAGVSGLKGDDQFTGSYDLYREAGESAGAYEIMVRNAMFANENYTVATKPGTFVITALGEAALIANDAEKPYDGTPLEPSGFTPVGLAEGDYFDDVVLEGSQVDVGESAVAAVSFVIRNAAGEDVTASYANVTVVSGTLTIVPAAVTIDVADAAKIAGETDPMFTGTVTGLVAAGDLGEILYGRTNADEDAGVYADVITATYTANPNYTVTVVPGTFTIAAAPVVPPAPVTPAVPPTPTPGTTPATPPGTVPGGPLAPIIAPVVEALEDAVTPLAGPQEETIGDNENPLAGYDRVNCWVHYYLILGIIVTVLYGAGVLVRRINFTRKLKDFEDDVLGIEDESAAVPAPASLATEGKEA